MSAFAKVVAAGSYAEAGRRLGLTRSAVGKGVMELERLLGARLLDRTTRRVVPTEAGRAYYERCVAILTEVEETEMQISRLHDEPKGCSRSTRQCPSPADLHRRARHQGRPSGRGAARQSADGAWALCALCAEPVSCGQDTPVHRFPG